MVASLSYGVAKSAKEGAFVSAASSGSSSRSVNASQVQTNAGKILSRGDVFAIADSLTVQFEVYKNYIDGQIAKNAFVDTGESYEAVLETVIKSVQMLHEVAFDLPMARTLKLGRDRQLFELLCELYGKEGFDRADEFIMDNGLNADEIGNMPTGIIPLSAGNFRLHKPIMGGTAESDFRKDETISVVLYWMRYPLVMSCSPAAT